MSIDLLSIHYDNIHEIPYLNGGTMFVVVYIRFRTVKRTNK